MGYVPPPEKLLSKELERRISQGANTMAEIDPAFAEWVLSGPWGWFQKIFKTKAYKKLYEPLFPKREKEK